MTIRRDFQISDFDAEKLIDEACLEWDNIEGVLVDEDEPEITQDVDGNKWAKAWVQIGDKNA